MKRSILGYLLIIILVVACGDPIPVDVIQFEELSSKRSGIDFSNDLKFDQKFNIYKYRNYYNGGGVGIGDVNNDGYVDIYFTANMKSNQLYLNNGDNTFTDITKSAGVGGTKSWSTGVSMVDINGDDQLDIYVCNSGNIEGDNKSNELFINNGDGTFSEQAAAYGLDDKGFSTHAAFFDYDRDGDIDVYLLNNSFQAIGSFNLKKNERPNRSEAGGDKLFRNDGDKFTDVSEAAGIYGSIIGFGLGVTVGDINLDGWQDIFVSNDFFERDYIYMNNGDGTFTENLESQMKSITGASMGADMADINNDGFPEIFVTEMLPEPHERLKTKTTFENWDRYQYNIENGYYHQFTRNMLHLNNGDGSFSEIGRLLGVEATDWSWGALIHDYDNDGLKDLFIANGIYKDLTDQDYINYISTAEVAASVITEDGVDFQRLTDVIPSNKVPNYMYHNVGDYTFEKVTDDWGLGTPSHSNGSAYADLDNDGDMDLVINNLNAPATIYLNHNELTHPESHYIKLELEGGDKNTQAVGARVTIHQDDNVLSYEQMPVKGFQSSVDPRPNIGLINEKIDSIVIFWPTGTKSVLLDARADQTLSINESSQQNVRAQPKAEVASSIFTLLDRSQLLFEHQENAFVDFDRDRLLYHMLSTEGPALCTGDFNRDGLIDAYLGGAKDQAGQLFIQTSNGYFRHHTSITLMADKVSEDVSCACFDADGDGDIDLYVASGGNEFPNSSSALIDRLYINDGKANFSKSNQILPSFNFENTSTVSPSDYDGDGDIDLFVGVRAKPFLIGIPTDGYLLQNDGSGKFKDITKQNAPALQQMGMVTDASWSDIDQDGDDDLIVVGEWMAIKVYENNSGSLTEVSSVWGLDSTQGWWNTVAASDLDNDGDIDFVVGNHGLNSRFTASRQKPVTLHVNDFDKNGTAEPLICAYFGEIAYPLALRHDLVAQLPSLKKKYPGYDSYKDQTATDIFGQEALDAATKSEVYLLESVILMNEGKDGFSIKKLPKEAQLSPVYAVAIADLDGDENQDIILGGNFYAAKPEVGRYDASYGVFLKGDGQGNFNYLPNRTTGLYIDGQVRGLSVMEQQQIMVVARNDAPTLLYKYGGS